MYSLSLRLLRALFWILLLKCIAGALQFEDGADASLTLLYKTLLLDDRYRTSPVHCFQNYAATQIV